MPVNRINKTKSGITHYARRHGAYTPQRDEPRYHELPPGIYRLGEDNEGNIFFVPHSSMTDTLVKLPNSVGQQIITRIKAFWDQESKDSFDEYGIVYKYGVIMHGAQGTGKTCTIAELMEYMVGMGGIVIFNPSSELCSKAIHQAREVNPDLKVMVVFEEFDRICNDSDFASLLDGELQVDNVVYVATTNYLDKVPNRIKKRTRRFAMVVEVFPPDEVDRRTYLTAKLYKDDPSTVEEWVRETEGMVIDQITDVIISVKCFKLSLREAVDKIKEMGYVESSESQVQVRNSDVDVNDLKLYGNNKGVDLQEMKKVLIDTIRSEVEQNQAPSYAATVTWDDGDKKEKG